MSQRERIERWLRERGSQGVHSFELYEARMPRGAAVIHTLREAGLQIESHPETYKGEAQGVRYILHGQPPTPTATPEPEPDALFAPPMSRPLNPYDYDLRAA